MKPIERVARAMWESHPNHEPWDEFAGTVHVVPFEIYARAAITALMTPSEGMIEAGMGAVDPLDSGLISEDERLGAILRAMLQSALDEGPQG